MTSQHTNTPCNPTDAAEPAPCNPSRRTILAGIAATTAGASVATVATVANAAGDIGPNDRRLLELDASIENCERRYNEGPGRMLLSNPEYEPAAERLGGELAKLEKRVVATPADTAIGLVVKFHRAYGVYDGELTDERIMNSLGADIERIAGARS